MKRTIELTTKKPTTTPGRANQRFNMALIVLVNVVTWSVKNALSLHIIWDL